MATRLPSTGPPPAGGPVWAKITIAMGLILAFVSAALAYAMPSILAVTQSGRPAGSGTASGLPGGRLTGPIDILLVGEADSHADSITVLHIPASHDEAYLLPLERDLLVRLPPWPPSGYLGGQATLTETFFHGVRNGAGWDSGAKLVAQAVSRITGLRFDGLAVTDFEGFQDAVDALGSVRMCIDQETYSHHTVFVEGDPQSSGTRMRGHKQRILYQKGCQDLPGWAAVDYARERSATAAGDHDRRRIQMQLLKAIAHKATSVGALMAAVGRSLILDTHGRPLGDVLATLTEITATDLLMVKPSQPMFEAVARDDVGGFLLEHPQSLVVS